MSDYPIELITNYRAGKISRQQFIKQFSDWQKSHGINYDCKGTADERGVHVEYRGVTATIRDGKLSFITGDNCDPNSPTHFLWHEANSVFEFQRQVDYAFNQEFNAFKNASYYAGESYEANLHGDTDRRGEMQQKQNYFLQQAKKWGALWN